MESDNLNHNTITSNTFNISIKLTINIINNVNILHLLNNRDYQRFKNLEIRCEVTQHRFENS